MADARARAKIRDRSASALLLLAAVLVLGTGWGQTQQPACGHGGTGPNLQSPAQWAAAAAATEVTIIEHENHFSLRYTVHRTDSNGTRTREVIDTPGGRVARLVRRNGRLLTAREDADERSRLREILDSPKGYKKREERDSALETYAIGLIRLMPKAMLYTYAAGQPRCCERGQKTVVIEFRPDPAFRPPTLVAELLTGLEGRLWIDTGSKHLTRVEARVLHNVNFGWGFLARIYAGGTVMLEQTDVGDDMWVYSQVTEHLRIREMLMRTEVEDVNMQAGNFRPIPSPLSVPQAVRELLALQIPLRPETP